MGQVRVPKDALWGASTQRAVENFPISGQGMPRRFIHAFGLLKLACARANRKQGGLDEKTAEVIETAAQEVAEGKLDDQFPVDVFQTGSGTSSNMNVNEVVANRASQLLGEKIGSKAVHPNDHVNMGQSSNDTVPTAMHLAAVLALEEDLLPALDRLQSSLEQKAADFDEVLKIGRTHLQDAVPIRLGQEFSGYAAMIRKGRARVESTLDGLRELAIGGTAVGTGLNAYDGFGSDVADELTELTGTAFRETDNHFEAQGARDAYVFASGALNTVAASMMKIANDLRLLASGPRCGLGEIILPAIQPGSSIMPGKVNPVVCESVVQVGAQVNGNHQAITVGGQWGQLDLNVMKPLMTRNLLESIELLANVAEVFVDKCIDGIEADEERCAEYIERSTAIATKLNPYIGYEKAAEVAKTSYKERIPVRQVVVDMGLMTEEEVEEALDIRAMTEPGEN